MKTFFSTFISLFFISNSIHAGMFFNKPKEPSDAFDGVYTFSHICFNKKTGKQYSGDYYDGSKFVISEGKVSNNKGFCLGTFVVMTTDYDLCLRFNNTIRLRFS